jgi:hypothetical protein
LIKFGPRAFKAITPQGISWLAATRDDHVAVTVEITKNNATGGEEKALCAMSVYRLTEDPPKRSASLLHETRDKCNDEVWRQRTSIVKVPPKCALFAAKIFVRKRMEAVITLVCKEGKTWDDSDWSQAL